jgi:hypothetical protein
MYKVSSSYPPFGIKKPGIEYLRCQVSFFISSPQTVKKFVFKEARKNAYNQMAGLRSPKLNSKYFEAKEISICKCLYLSR